MKTSNLYEMLWFCDQNGRLVYRQEIETNTEYDTQIIALCK